MVNIFNALGIHTKKNEDLSKHTSFRVGGPARYFVEPALPEQLIAALSYVREANVPFFVMGNGSNLLASDEGFDGVVICLGERFAGVDVKGNCITANAGDLLSKTAIAAAKNGLSGLEFAHGIPGSVGGGVYMNAGAYGGQMADVVKKIKYLDNALEIKEIAGAEAEFGYRTSIFKRNKGWVVLSADFELSHGAIEEIEAKMTELSHSRREKQPLNYPSAGSTFKRPEGYFAAKLIEDCGLKGVSIGGAQVSEKHSGFIINKGGATCDDISRLMEHVRSVVLEQTGVELEAEVERIEPFKA